MTNRFAIITWIILCVLFIAATISVVEDRKHEKAMQDFAAATHIEGETCYD